MSELNTFLKLSLVNSTLYWTDGFRYTVKLMNTTEALTSELGISSTTREDSGRYYCIASNSYGRDEMSIQLYIQGEPMWTQASYVKCNICTYIILVRNTVIVTYSWCACLLISLTSLSYPVLNPDSYQIMIY